MQATELKEGEIVQLDPERTKNPMFAGCFMVVTEPKTWGAQGYVQGLGEDMKPGGQAYYRAKWEEMERTAGIAVWIPR
jgi:hypothetical protein